MRSTSLLKSFMRKHPRAYITWVTEPKTAELLRSHPRIDLVLENTYPDLLAIEEVHFDAVYVIDKDPKAAGLLRKISFGAVYGFVTDLLGRVVLPATPAANYLWRLGLDNEEKFYRNQKPETQLLAEALELDYNRDPYDLPLSTSENNIALRRKRAWKFATQGDLVVGLNLGGSPVLPKKALDFDWWQSFIRNLGSQTTWGLVLLGGPDESRMMNRLAKCTRALTSPVNRGPRDGLLSVAACDLIFSNDSLGLHMAISQRVPVLAWFGPSCAHEIDFFGRGRALRSAMPCSPCWKRSCSLKPACNQNLSQELVLGHLLEMTNPQKPETLNL